MQITLAEKKRRVASRNPTEAVIACRLFASSRVTPTVDGVMRNFSKEGSYIETSHEFKLGTILYVRLVDYPPRPLSLAAEALPRSICLAEVKWRQKMVGKNTIQYGVGLRYLD